MSLTAALQVGRSALETSQRAIEVTGNNLANVATPGYHRQRVELSSAISQEIRDGVWVGRGVQLQNIVRQVDEALEGRLRGAVSDESASQASRDILKQIEAIQNELTDIDLSSRLTELFNAFSELANSPNDDSLRSLAVRQAESLTSFIQTYRTDLVRLREQVDSSIERSAVAADELLNRIAEINREIVVAAPAQPNGAHSLRDQRDMLLQQLSQYLDISTVEQPSGTVDVFVGSTPIVLNGRSRGIELRQQTVNGELSVTLHLKADGSQLNATSGRLGAMVAGRENDIQHAVEFIDTFAAQLIQQVNRIHSHGQGKTFHTDVTGSARVLDSTAALNSEDASLDFAPGNGSFVLHVTDASTGLRHATQISIDLDGQGTDTSLDDLAAALSAVDNVTASVTSDGRLRIRSDSGNFKLSFSDDSSGVLAALGVNTFFQGSDATDIAVNAAIVANPGLIATGRDHIVGDNTNVLDLAQLRDTKLNALGGISLTSYWSRHVEDYGIRTADAVSRLDADVIVRENLESQVQSVTGVNADEEAINLLIYQRSYQGAARFLTVVDEMLQTLINLV